MDPRLSRQITWLFLRDWIEPKELCLTLKPSPLLLSKARSTVSRNFYFGSIKFPPLHRCHCVDLKFETKCWCTVEDRKRDQWTWRNRPCAIASWIFSWKRTICYRHSSSSTNFSMMAGTIRQFVSNSSSLILPNSLPIRSLASILSEVSSLVFISYLTYP